MTIMLTKRTGEPITRWTRGPWLLGLAILAIATTGCVTEPKSFTKTFEVVYASTSDRVVWRAKGADQTFKQVILEPMRIRLRSGQPDFRAPGQFSIEFQQVVSAALEPAFPIVTAGGRGTVRVQAFITDAVETEQLRERAAPLGVDPSTGRADKVLLEVRFFDSRSDELIAALVSATWSNVYAANLRDPEPRSIREALNPFAQSLRLALEQRTLESDD
jgi:hypothetical protein